MAHDKWVNFNKKPKLDTHTKQNRLQQPKYEISKLCNALMERIQCLATHFVKGMIELPYEDRFRRLNLFSLERRWLRGDLISAYNIFHGRLDLPQA